MIRVNNEMPCVKFVLSSSDLIRNLTPNKLGVYTLAVSFLIDDRLWYVMETPTEIFALISTKDPANGNYISWAVRYEIESFL